MGWFIVGLVLGTAGLWLGAWARAKNISIQWYAWIFIVLAALLFALMVMDFRTLTTATEPSMAEGILWLYGIPGLVLILIAVSLIWWQNKKMA